MPQPDRTSAKATMIADMAVIASGDVRLIGLFMVVSILPNFFPSRGRWCFAIIGFVFVGVAPHETKRSSPNTNDIRHVQFNRCFHPASQSEAN